jgi:hypothetical protein
MYSWCICQVWKMLLLTSCPTPNQNQLKQLIFKKWPPSKTVVQKRSVCYAAHPSN